MNELKINEDVIKQLDFILLNTSQFFKDTILDFLTDISAGYQLEGNNYDKIIVEFLDELLSKMDDSLSEQD